MITVTPNHDIAKEAYSTVKVMNCEYISIFANEFRQSDTETGYYIAGIAPSTAEEGFNREQWLTEYEQLNP